MIIDNVKRLTLFGLLTSLLGCTNVSHTPQVFLGENLITPYTGFLAGWKVIIENQAHYHSRMWQHPALGFKSSYVVSVTPKEKHNNKYFRNIIDKPGIESCINFSSETINSTIDTNYPKEFWQTTCLRKNGSEAKILHLLIQGNDSLYHIQKIWQDKYSLEEISLWQSRLEQSYVCDSRSLEAKCPQNND
ncbi:hypothetical protein [Cognaticolwellia mytili]|uniref:hypothetical protein n=1 Tax=Cognaticolwellia mytili TaxID=1888913 RepID=UPI000A16F853|nr:hypothetical protein [Cognaticolwellia mytili]